MPDDMDNAQEREAQERMLLLEAARAKKEDPEIALMKGFCDECGVSHATAQAGCMDWVNCLADARRVVEAQRRNGR